MSYDQSYLDRKYFIDKNKYNCPYCNRKSITYSVIGNFSFDWSNEKSVYGYLVKCGGDSCGQTSLHLSNHHIGLYNYQTSIKFDCVYFVDKDGKNIKIDVSEFADKEIELDDLFFYHQPTSFFTLDNRIKSSIRELVSEAEGCAKMSYMVGASGCLRKAIYEFLENEYKGNDAPDNYEDKIKGLKVKYPNITAEYFDALSNIQDMASKNLHEGSWEVWKKQQFDFLLAVIKELLVDIYVRPKEKASVLQKVLSLRPQKKEESIQSENQ